MTARITAPRRECRIESAAANERLGQHGRRVSMAQPPEPRPDQAPDQATAPRAPFEQLYRALTDQLFAVVRKYPGLAEDVAGAIRPFHPQLQARHAEARSCSK